MSSQKILESPLIGILRGLTRDQLREVVPALRRGGLRSLEITMNTAGAEDQLREAVELGGSETLIGAGTVTSVELLERALAAGAQFIVTPSLRMDVVRACVERHIPVFPGAFTPTEVYRAWEAGASMVKVFPADSAGPAFIRALRGPFPDVKLLPTGGVDLKTLPDFAAAGADGFGLGSPLLQRDKVEQRDWLWLQDRARAFVEAWSRVRRTTASPAKPSPSNSTVAPPSGTP